EFVGRRPRLVERLSGVAEKLAESWEVSDHWIIAAQVSRRVTVGKPPMSVAKLPMPWNQGAFSGLTNGVDGSSSDNDIDLLFDGSLRMRQGIPSRSAFEKCFLISDIVSRCPYRMRLSPVLLSSGSFLIIALTSHQGLDRYSRRRGYLARELHRKSPRNSLSVVWQWWPEYSIRPRSSCVIIPPCWAGLPESVATETPLAGVLVEEPVVGRSLTV
ncbi:hypothetical protein B296_00026060, partial [Ensete ventricosum]